MSEEVSEPETVMKASFDVFILVGASFAALDSRSETKEIAARLWALIPFLKAAMWVAREHEEECAELWQMEKRQPMPYGCEPLEKAGG